LAAAAAVLRRRVQASKNEAKVRVPSPPPVVDLLLGRMIPEEISIPTCARARCYLLSASVFFLKKKEEEEEEKLFFSQSYSTLPIGVCSFDQSSVRAR
jgi:hypothetical protein